MQTVIEELLRETKREGIEDLIIALDKGGFYKAPSSTKFHLCKKGGLAIHSYNVYKLAKGVKSGLESDVPDESITIAALLHDVGKMGGHGKALYIPNILKAGNQSEKEPYKTNGELAYIDHAIRSAIIVSEYIQLTEEEEFAIIYHNGLYNKVGYDLTGKERPLQMIIHWADMWASRVKED